MARGKLALPPFHRLGGLIYSNPRTSSTVPRLLVVNKNSKPSGDRGRGRGAWSNNRSGDLHPYCISRLPDHGPRSLTSRRSWRRPAMIVRGREYGEGTRRHHGRTTNRAYLYRAVLCIRAPVSPHAVRVAVRQPNPTECHTCNPAVQVVEVKSVAVRHLGAGNSTGIQTEGTILQNQPPPPQSRISSF